jgi:hypothetical protein
MATSHRHPCNQCHKVVKALPFSQRRSKSLRTAPHAVKMLLPAEALCPKDSRLRTKKAGRNPGRPPGEGMIEPKVISPRARSLLLQLILQPATVHSSRLICRGACGASQGLNAATENWTGVTFSCDFRHVRRSSCHIQKKGADLP